MTRPLSALLRRQLFSPFRDEDVRIFIVLDHSTFDAPFRFVSADPNEFASLTSRGDVYQAFPFEIGLLTDDDNAPEAFLRIQNVSDLIGSTILALPDDAITVTIRLAMRTTPNVIEYEAPNLELVDIEITSVAILGRIFLRGFATEPCPGRRLTSRMSPGFFR
jgi:hypothetical protein